MLLAALTCLTSVSAKKVAPITVNQLYQMSPVIVRAQVFSIAKASGVRIATAKVLDTFKGQAGVTVSFVAQKTWTCDVSNAKTGEEVLLYLIPAKPESDVRDMVDVSDAVKRFNEQGKPLFYIGHSGRGRLALTKGKTDFTLPVTFVQNNFSDDRWNVNADTRLPNGKLCRHVKKDDYTITLTNILSYR